MPQPRTWLKASKSAARPQHHEEHGDDAVDGDEDGHKCSQLQPFSMPKRKADQNPIPLGMSDQRRIYSDFALHTKRDL